MIYIWVVDMDKLVIMGLWIRCHLLRLLIRLNLNLDRIIFMGLEVNMKQYRSLKIKTNIDQHPMQYMYKNSSVNNKSQK